MVVLAPMTRECCPKCWLMSFRPVFTTASTRANHRHTTYIARTSCACCGRTLYLLAYVRAGRTRLTSRRTDLFHARNSLYFIEFGSQTRHNGAHRRVGWFSIALGLNRPPREFGFTHYSTILIPEWVNSLSDYARCAEILADAPGTRMPLVGLTDYSAIDSGLSPDGPHLVSVGGGDRVANREGLDDQAYRAKRDGWLDAIVAGIDRSFPGFAGAVVQREMATASTMRHYLNTPDGAVSGFAPEPPKGLPTPLGRDVATTVPGLWLAAAYGGAGGFTGTMLTGMLAAQAAMKSQRSHPSVTTTGT